MIDSTVQPPQGDQQENDIEIPAPVDTVAIDGTRPQVGDNVKLVIRGPVTRVVNDVVYVKPETVNDAPLPAPILDPDDNVSESDRLRNLSEQVDANDTYSSGY